MRIFKRYCLFLVLLLASCGGDVFAFGVSDSGSMDSAGGGTSSGGSGSGGTAGGSGGYSGSVGGESGSSTSGFGGDAGTTSGGSAGATAGASGAVSDASGGSLSDALPDARDASPDAPTDVLMDQLADIVDAPDTECQMTGLLVRWHAISLNSLQEITGLHASIGALPPVKDVCVASDDLYPGNKHDYACCLRMESAGNLKGSMLYFNFRLSDASTGCTTTGCPLPFDQYDVILDGVEVTNLSVVLENPSCDVAAGNCQWVLRAEL